MNFNEVLIKESQLTQTCQMGNFSRAVSHACLEFFLFSITSNQQECLSKLQHKWHDDAFEGKPGQECLVYTEHELFLHCCVENNLHGPNIVTQLISYIVECTILGLNWVGCLTKVSVQATGITFRPELYLVDCTLLTDTCSLRSISKKGGQKL